MDLQALWVAADDVAEKVIDPLKDTGMIAGEILESQIGPLVAHGVKQHRSPESSNRNPVFLEVAAAVYCKAIPLLIYARHQ